MKKLILPSTELFFFFFFMIVGQCMGQQIYRVASKPWKEAYGNHRAVLIVKKPAGAIYLNLLWRRHDPNPQKRRLVIVNAISKDTVQNIYRIEVNQLRCKLVFGPVTEPGTYNFYYLPFKPDHKAGSYRYGYYPPEHSPNKKWVENNRLESPEYRKKLPQALIKEIQARTKFDSFYPMEIIPSSKEKHTFFKKYDKNYYVFPERRTYPIEMRDEIPLRWVKEGPGKPFYGTALRNEYYVFQLGVYAHKNPLNNVDIGFSNLISPKDTISSSLFTCFNTEGINTYGKHFTKIVNVGKDSVQAFWIGINLPINIKPGNYRGSLTVSPQNVNKRRISIHLRVKDSVLVDHGYSQPWRLSRLHWLNSTLGLNNQPTKPFTSIILVRKHSFKICGKKIVIAKTGMPASIQVWGTEILEHPISYVVKSSIGKEKFDYRNFKIDMKTPGKVFYSWSTYSKNFKLTGNARLEFDGLINYRLELTARRNINLENFSLKIPFRTNVAEYMMGMGLHGTQVPEMHKAGWKGPHNSFWVGNTYGGLQTKLKGNSYNGPLLNLYKPKYPQSWYNNNKGKFTISEKAKDVLAAVSCGERRLNKGQRITFKFDFMITPIKKINTYSQFTNRYYQDAGGPLHSKKETEELLSSGVKVLNVHQGNKYNPYINYPLITIQKLKHVVNYWHKRGVRVKIYYTDRELSNHAPELWALRSLGNEILGTKGVGYPGNFPWLKAHLINDYKPRWYTPLNNGTGTVDASILTTGGDTRWDNFYVAAVNWLVRNVGIDGLYLDDVSYNSHILERVRKVLNKDKSDALIDLHSNNLFSKGPAMQYMNFFPFIDKLWLGEGFNYNKMDPAQWLVEVSGIPYGLMGDMLQGGGNPWRGMVYGMTARFHRNSEGVKPRDIWKIWDSFGIAKAKMVGYWDHHPVVTNSNPKIKITAYVKKGKVLIAIASWAPKKVNVKLNIDWKRIGMRPGNVTLVAPAIKNFQPNRNFLVNNKIPIKPEKGWMLILKSKNSK